MAITVLGGLLSSTLLNLFVLPALAERYVRVQPEKSAEQV
jgi:Cu/Ag efflux pump CusA